LEISREWVEDIRARMPELPDVKKARFVADLGLSDYDADVLAADRSVAEFFEAVVAAGGEPKRSANWITGELFRLMKAENLEINEVEARTSPQRLVALMDLVERKTINLNTAKEVLAAMLESGRTPQEIVQARGLVQVSDEAVLAATVAEILDAHPGEVAQYLGGKETLSGWFMGQVMKATQGKADPQLARQVLLAQLEARRPSSGSG
jgi:aspartyl-tRNA(Asn)/glutamyl-tRNA(Gln) amidotransferase subunit B